MELTRQTTDQQTKVNTRKTEHIIQHQYKLLTIDIITLQQSSSIGEDVHAPLFPIVDFISLQGWVAVRCYPDTSILVTKYLVLNKLTTPLEIRQPH